MCITVIDVFFSYRVVNVQQTFVPVGGFASFVAFDLTFFFFWVT